MPDLTGLTAVAEPQFQVQQNGTAHRLIKREIDKAAVSGGLFRKSRTIGVVGKHNREGQDMAKPVERHIGKPKDV